VFHALNIVTDKQYEDFLWWYNHQVASAMGERI
jgi:hypothetical protein